MSYDLATLMALLPEGYRLERVERGWRLYDRRGQLIADAVASGDQYVEAGRNPAEMLASTIRALLSRAEMWKTAA